VFPDNWIYVHTPGVRVGRVQNFGSWSPYLVKDGYTCLGLEYFVNEGDELWSASDERLIDLAREELAALGVVDASRIEAGYVTRVPKAYPVYDAGYATGNRPPLDRGRRAECVPCRSQRDAQAQQPGPLMLTAMLAENVSVTP
jgi:protoporphyrinogen oxidase